MKDEPVSAGGLQGAASASAPGARVRRLHAAVLVAGAVTVADAAVLGWAFNPVRAGTASMLIAIGALYAALAAAALLRLHRRGELRHAMRPAFGDVSFGAFAAGALYVVAMLAHGVLTPHGTPREAWIVRVYLELGDPELLSHLVTGGIFVIAALEEIVWRGLVLRVLEEPLGARPALFATTALFGLAHLPTAFLLRDPTVGPNPLIVMAALGCGLVWGALAQRATRLVPAILAHALFTWAIVEFPIWRP